MGKMGTGLPFVAESTNKIELVLKQDGGPNGFDWPLRSHLPGSVYLAQMTDWMWEKYPTNWQSLLLGVMALARHKTFITLTKRHINLAAMLTAIETTPNRTILVPAYKSFTSAIMKRNLTKNNDMWSSAKHLRIEASEEMRESKLGKGQALTPLTKACELPWPPPNIIFGFSVSKQEDADEIAPYLYNFKRAFPLALTAISQEPALEVINWKDAELQPGSVDWIIWGGETGNEARPASRDSWFSTLNWCSTNNTPVYFKQTGTVLAKQLGGELPTEAWLPVRQYPNMAGRVM